MKTALQIVSVIVAVVLAALLSAAVYLKFGVPEDRLLADLRADLAAETGLAVEIGDDPRTVVWPRPGIELGAVRLSDPAQPDAPDLLVAERGLLTFSLDDIRAGYLKARTLTLDGARLSLWRDADGRWTWPWTQPAIANPLRALHLSAATVSLTDARLAAPLQLTEADVAIAFDGAGQPAKISGILIKGDHRADVEISVGNLGDLLGGRWSRLSLLADAAPSSLTWRGRVALDPAQNLPFVEGQLEMTVTSPDLVAWGLMPKTTPQMLVEIPEIGVVGDITVRPERLRAQLDLGASVGGRETTLDLRLAGDGGWRDADGAEMNLVLRVAGLLSAYLDGPVNLDVGLDATLSFSILDTDALLRWTDQRLPAFVEAPSRARGIGRFGFRNPVATLNEAEIFLDETRIDLSQAKLEIATRPQLVLTAALDRLDLSEFLRMTADSVDLDLASLSAVPDTAFDLSLTLEPKRIDFGASRSTGGRLSLHRRQGSLAVEATQLRLFGGDVAVSGLLGGLAPNALALDIRASGVEASRLLKRVAYDGLNGPAEAELRISVPDISADQPWREAIAVGSLSVFGGTLAMPDLFAMAAGAPETPFSVLSASFGGTWEGLDFPELRITRAAREFSGALRISTADRSISGTLSAAPTASAAGAKLALAGTLTAPEVARAVTAPPLSPGAQSTDETLLSASTPTDPVATASETPPDAGAPPPHTTEPAQIEAGIPIPVPAPRPR